MSDPASHAVETPAPRRSRLSPYLWPSILLCSPLLYAIGFLASGANGKAASVFFPAAAIIVGVLLATCIGLFWAIAVWQRGSAIDGAAIDRRKTAWAFALTFVLAAGVGLGIRGVEAQRVAGVQAAARSTIERIYPGFQVESAEWSAYVGGWGDVQESVGFVLRDPAVPGFHITGTYGVSGTGSDTANAGERFGGTLLNSSALTPAQRLALERAWVRDHSDVAVSAESESGGIIRPETFSISDSTAAKLKKRAHGRRVYGIRGVDSKGNDHIYWYALDAAKNTWENI